MSDRYRTGYYLGEHPTVTATSLGCTKGKLARSEAHQRMAELTELRSDLADRLDKVDEAIAYYDNLFKTGELYHEYEIWVHGESVTVHKGGNETPLAALDAYGRA